MNRWTLLVLLSLGFTSCGLFKKAGEIPSNIKNARQLKRGLEIAELNYDWYKARTKLRYKSKGQNVKASGEIKMQKDSLVWARVTKFIEVGRLMLTPEKMTLLNRLQSQYVEKSVETALKEFGLEDGSFGSLQKLLVGDYPFQIESADQLIFENNEIGIVHKHTLGELQAAMAPNSLKLNWLRAKNDAGQTINVNYSNYQVIAGNWIPSNVNIELGGEQTMSLDLQFSNIELSSSESVEFEIPSDYKKVD